MNATTYPAASTMESEQTLPVPSATSATTPSVSTASVPAPPAPRSARTLAATTARTARTVLSEGRSYYSSGPARIRLVVLSAALTYGGGAAMFWLHAIVRGEQGPAIANVWHWLLDSTLGFVGLTPVLAVLLPLTAKVLNSRTKAYAAIGALFALVTAPGPILHNLIAGSGTPLATAATGFFGTDPGVAAAHAHAAATSAEAPSAISSVIAQVSFGLPVYIGLAVLAGTALHHLQTRTHTASPTTDQRLVLATA